MRKIRSRRDAGLTMIEVVIASIILTAIVGMTSWMVWSSSKHIATAEIGVQMEISAREVLTAMSRELHQSRMTKIQKVRTDLLIPTDPASLNPFFPTPGVVPVASAPQFPIWMPHVFNPDSNKFDGIRFRTPGAMMDMTGIDMAGQVTVYDPVTKTKSKVTPPPSRQPYFKNSASSDKNGSTYVDPITGKVTVIDNFDLSRFKVDANANQAEWFYEVQYWWEIAKSSGEDVPTAVGPGPSGFVPNGLDDNANGVADEGVIKKMETWYRSNLTVERRTVSTVLRDVTDFKMWVPGVPAFVVPNPGTDPSIIANYKYDPSNVNNQFKAGLEQSLFISITVSRSDPQHPKDTKRNIVRTYSTTVDLRN